MPTGYTAPIKDGISFREYALGCARTFVPLTTIRDGVMNTSIPDEFKPSDYYSNQLKDRYKKLTFFTSATDAELEKRMQKEYNDDLEFYYEHLKVWNKEKEKYEDMLVQAKAYKPPTPEHIRYAEFLVSQLEQTIEYDYNYNLEDMTQVPIKKEVKTYRTENIERIQKEIQYYEKEDLKEMERAKSRTEWVKALKKSLENY